MASAYQSRTRPPSADILQTDSLAVDVIGGNSAEWLTERLNGREYTQNVRSNTYLFAIAAAAVALPAQNATTQKLMVWNPAGSGKVYRFHKFQMGIVANPGTAGAVTAWTITLSHLLGCGAQVASGSGQITAVATPVAPVVPYLNAGGLSTSICSVAGNVTCVAPVFNRTLWTIASAATPASENRFNQFQYDLFGDFLMSPGTAIFIGCQTSGPGAVSQNATVNFQMFWSEIPIS